MHASAELVLSRLGNFPGRDLLLKRHGQTAPLDAFLRMEMRVHELDNTIIDEGGHRRILTDFQYDLLTSFNRHPVVSVSAPTSAGKSFLLSLEVLAKLKKADYPVVVYVVPTRALIRQVVLDLRRLIADSEISKPLVRSMPTPLDQNEAPHGIVYVLTQERLLSLLSSPEKAVTLTSLIVDEAQSIGDGARGILLQTAVERAIEKHPKIELIFASPLAKNPEIFLDLFTLSAGQPFTESHSPVSQNLYLAEISKDTSREAHFSLQADDRIINLGRRKLNFTMRGSPNRRLALFARSILRNDDPEDSCIIYADGAGTAERIARHLTRTLKPPNIDEEVTDFATFLEEQIHPDYSLIKYLRFGVAFHYSNMPSSVRSGVEDLFRNRKLRFLVCTSTLLQGVNLPARHIVVEAPTRGPANPIERGDFLNLAGRAGRLTKEFHGNVWCLRPDLWKLESYKGDKLHEIKAAFDRAISHQAESIRRALDDDGSLKDSAIPVSALGRIFTEFVQKPRPDVLETLTLSSDDPLALAETVHLLQEFRQTTNLPSEIFSRNAGNHPIRLQALYSFLAAHDNLEGFIPIRPKMVGVNDRLKEIFQICQKYLRGVHNNSYSFHSVIASDWLHEKPLQQIIAGEIAYKRSQAAQQGKKLNTKRTIHNTVFTIENEIRFNYVRQVRAYIDILSTILRQRGLAVQADNLPPFHLYLECGAYSPATLNLISLGLSRISALALRHSIHLSASSTPEECLEKCLAAIANAKNLKLPREILKEVATFGNTK